MSGSRRNWTTYTPKIGISFGLFNISFQLSESSHSPLNQDCQNISTKDVNIIARLQLVSPGSWFADLSISVLTSGLSANSGSRLKKWHTLVDNSVTITSLITSQHSVILPTIKSLCSLTVSRLCNKIH